MKQELEKTGEPLVFTPEEMDELIANAKQNPTIDWEQRRYEVAKAAIQGILSNDLQSGYASSNYGDKDTPLENDIAEYAVACADALIEELKTR